MGDFIKYALVIFVALIVIFWIVSLFQQDNGWGFILVIVLGGASILWIISRFVKN